MKRLFRASAVAFAALALVLSACGGPQAPVDPTYVKVDVSVDLAGSAAKASAGELSPQGFPYDPADGSIAGTVEVYVYDKNDAPVLFEVAGSTYTAAPTGAAFIELTAADNTATVNLPSAGSPYRFESLGKSGGAVVAYDDQTQNVTVVPSVFVTLRSVLEDAVLVPRYPTSVATPGQVLDLMLIVMANDNADFPNAYLQVPIGDFTATYGTVTNADLGATSNRGVRLTVSPLCSSDVTVAGHVTGIVESAGQYESGDVAFNGGAGFSLACPPSAEGGMAVDLTPPTVTLDGFDPVSGVVTGTANDDYGIAKVEIYDGPVLLASTDPTDENANVALIAFTPLSDSFTTTLKVAPIGGITVVARDPSGNEAHTAPTFDYQFVYVDASAAAGGDGSAANPFDTIQAGINAVAPGGTVFVRNGTYSGTFLHIAKPLKLLGESEGGVVVELSTTGYGVDVTANDVTLENLTILGTEPSESLGGNYGVKVYPEGLDSDPGTTDPVLTNFAMKNVTVRGFGRSEVDLLGVDGAVLTNVTADGDDTAGVGIAVSGSRNVALIGVSTTGNQWGGVGLYSTQFGSINGVSRVRIDAASTFTEPLGVYSETLAGPIDAAIEELVLEGFTHVVKNPDHRPNGHLFTFYVRSEAEAFALASFLPSPEGSYVQKLGTDGSGYSVIEDDFVVGVGMGLQAAVNAASAGATIELATGTHTMTTETVIGKALTLTAQPGAVIETTGTSVILRITGAGATLEGLTIVKTDTAGTHNLIQIGASDVTVRDNVISGQWASGDEYVTRAMVIQGGLSGLLIDGNTIYGLRQPAYINGPTYGTISNNKVYRTRGWVIDGALMSFTGNTWRADGLPGASENEECDMALLKDTPAGAPYDPLVDLLAANNDAVICDQR